MVNSQLVQKESKLKTIAVDLLFDLIAGIAFGVSVNVFTAPNHIAPGGVIRFCYPDELHLRCADRFDVLYD